MKNAEQLVNEYIDRIEDVGSIYSEDFKTAKHCAMVDVRNSIKVIEEMTQITWDVRKIYVEELKEVIKDIRNL